MKISAVIPTYNRQTEVTRAIDSVLSQTFPVDEVIVVDDGSSDGTAKSISSRFGPKINLILQENRGVSAARNRGVSAATCEWIAFLDSDDIWLPTKIESQIKALSLLGPEVGFCFSNCFFDGHPNGVATVFQDADFEDSRRFGVFENPIMYLLGPPSPFRLQSSLVSRSVLEQIGGFDEQVQTMEDLDVLFRLTFKTKFCFVAEPLMRIDRSPSRPHGLCETFGIRSDRKYDDLKRIYNQWLTMPEVAGTECDRTIRGLLRQLSYDSAESKLHEFRLRPALQEIRQLHDRGDDYFPIIRTLLSRKIAKLRRNLFQRVRGRGESNRATVSPG